MTAKYNRMALRRPHRKSRHGCLACKRRRVKCDETRPICSNCSNRQSDCEYDSSNFIPWTNEPRHQRPSRSNPPECEDPPDLATLGTASPFGILGRLSEDVSPASPGNLNLTDLELLLQWCNSTHQTLSRNPRLDPIWRFLVTEEALASPFLMHGVLAVSALHLARIKPDTSSPTYIGTAVAHQNRALALFRELLGDINPSNAKAMFAFASIVVVYAFGFPHTPHPNDSGAVVDDLYQILVLCRGIQQVISRASTSLQDGSFSALLQLDEYTPYLPDDARAAIERLREANHACGQQDAAHDTAAYARVIDNFAEELSAVHGGMDSITVACRWAIRLKPPFVDFLREHSPMALVVLAYFCALLHSLRQDWCLDGWGARVAGAIWMLLDEQWRDLARWAMVQIFGEGFCE